MFLVLFSAIWGTSLVFGQVEKQATLPVSMSLPFAASRAMPLARMTAQQHLSIAVSLGYRDPGGVQKFVDAVSNPKSSDYRHFITPTEVGKRFGPTKETVAKLTSFLTANGMSVRLVGDNGLSVLADTTVAQAETAFNTKIYEFVAADGYRPTGNKLFSFVNVPSVPAELQPFVTDISGLESFTHPRALSYVTPPQVQTLYNLTPMMTGGSQGQGRTVGISNWDGFRLSGVPFEYSTYGLATPPGGVGSNITVKTVSGGAGSGGQAGEGDLDIQAILGVAPLCNLVIYDGGGSNLIGVLTLEANDNLADMISESYGWMLSPSTMVAAHNLHLSMSAQGMTYMAASGDSGTNLGNYYYPGIDPEVLSVGGTSCSVNSSGNRISEAGWGGSGGGWKPTSDPFNTLPGYQVGTGVPTTINYRLIPDVALDADPNSGYVVYLQGGFHVIGGTSGASPTFAGALGVATQQLIANGALADNGSGKYRLGRLQDLIYSLNGDSSVFYDVTSGGNGTLPNGTSSVAKAGWDFVTGWGAMDFSGFVDKLSGSGLAQFTLSPSSVEGGATAVTGTVRIIMPAPSGGTDVTISGGDSSVSYPTTVTIPEGSKSATFTLTTSAVSTSATESLTASLDSKDLGATLTVTPPPVSNLTITPGVAVGVASFSGTVTLLHAAPSSGVVVALSGGDSSVSYPAMVTVASGATSASFTMTSSMVATSVNETIKATVGTSFKTASVTLTGLSVATLTLSPTTVTGGVTVTGTVTLSALTGSSAVPVTLSGGDGSVSYPATVNIPAHAKSMTFKIVTVAVDSSVSESITATLGSSSKTASFALNVPAYSTFTLTPVSVFGGVSSVGKVTFSGPAGPSGIDVSLSGGDSSVGFPSTVTVAAGASSATFTVTTSVVSVNTTEALKATLNTTIKSATLTVKPAGVVSKLSFSPTTLAGGKPATGTVTLSGPAGPGGVVVDLSGGDSSVGYPSTLTIAAGASSKTFTVTTSNVTVATPEVLTASIGPSSAHGTLTLSATVPLTLTFAPTSVFGGVSAVGTVTLSGPAGSSGLVVDLSGGDSSVSYPATVTVASGASSATFTVTSSVVTVTTAEVIKATLNSSTKPATLTVKPAGIVSRLSFSPSTLAGGKPSTGTVTLSGPAGPSGVVVALSGGDSSVSYPSSVTIPAGGTTKTFAVTTSNVSVTTLETLTATIGPSSAKGTLSLAAAMPTAVTFAPASVFGGVSSVGTVTLNAPAGSSGLVVALSGGDSSVSYPATVTVAAGATSATFTVATSSVSATTSEPLTATLNLVTKTATLTLKPSAMALLPSSSRTRGLNALVGLMGKVMASLSAAVKGTRVL